MKGSSRGVVLRIRLMTILAAAFIAGAIVIFGMAALASMVLRLADLPFAWRVGLAAAILGGLGTIDLLAIKKGCYFPLGMRRQTPKSMIYHQRAASMVAAAWGFDTGLAVTTIRVAAITWGALVLVALGIASWWAGFGYGLGFVVPLVISILMQAPPDAPSSLAPRLEGLLRKRALAQSVSAVLLFTAGAVLLLGTFHPR